MVKKEMFFIDGKKYNAYQLLTVGELLKQEKRPGSTDKRPLNLPVSQSPRINCVKKNSKTVIGNSKEQIFFIDGKKYNTFPPLTLGELLQWEKKPGGTDKCKRSKSMCSIQRREKQKQEAIKGMELRLGVLQTLETIINGVVNSCNEENKSKKNIKAKCRSHAERAIRYAETSSDLSDWESNGEHYGYDYLYKHNFSKNKKRKAMCSTRRQEDRKLESNKELVIPCAETTLSDLSDWESHRGDKRRKSMCSTRSQEEERHESNKEMAIPCVVANSPCHSDCENEEEEVRRRIYDRLHEQYLSEKERESDVLLTLENLTNGVVSACSEEKLKKETVKETCSPHAQRPIATIDLVLRARTIPCGKTNSPDLSDRDSKGAEKRKVSVCWRRSQKEETQESNKELPIVTITLALKAGTTPCGKSNSPELSDRDSEGVEKRKVSLCWTRSQKEETQESNRELKRRVSVYWTRNQKEETQESNKELGTPHGM